MEDDDDSLLPLVGLPLFQQALNNHSEDGGKQPEVLLSVKLTARCDADNNISRCLIRQWAERVFRGDVGELHRYLANRVELVTCSHLAATKNLGSENLNSVDFLTRHSFTIYKYSSEYISVRDVI